MNHAPSVVSSSRLGRLGFAFALALLFYSCAHVYIYETRLNEPPEELPHLTYLQEIANEGRTIPDYRTSKIIRDGRGNYMGHPPLYYSISGLVGRGLGWDAERDYRNFREISALMVSAGVLLWALIALRLGFPPLWAAVLVGASAAVPMLPYLAGSINNDSLAYLSVAIFVYGLVRIDAAHSSRAGYITACVGMAVGLLTKGTVGLFLSAFAVAWLLLEAKRGHNHLKKPAFVIPAVVAIGLVGSYYLYALLTYGSLFPKTAALYANRPPPESHYGFAHFVWRFVVIIIKRLPVILAHKSLEPLKDSFKYIFYLMLLMPVLNLVIGRLASRRIFGPLTSTQLAFGLALLITVLAHLAYTWQAHVSHGAMAGLQPRYYSFLVPAVFLFAFEGARPRLTRALFFVFACCAVILITSIPNLATREHIQRYERR